MCAYVDSHFSHVENDVCANDNLHFRTIWITRMCTLRITCLHSGISRVCTRWFTFCTHVITRVYTRGFTSLNAYNFTCVHMWMYIFGQMELNSFTMDLHVCTRRYIFLQSWNCKCMHTLIQNFFARVFT
jgi:hypothetical protein